MTLSSIKQKFQNLPKFVRSIVKMFLVIFAIYSAFYLYTWPLRSKPSYSRDVSVVFNYNGDEYTINSTISLVNEGVAIDEGSMAWHTKWSSVQENNKILLRDSIEAGLVVQMWPEGDEPQMWMREKKYNKFVTVINSDNVLDKLNVEIKSVSFGEKKLF